MLKNNKGFSLIELMVVVAIIAILSTIAIPSYQSFQAKARQKEGFALLGAYYSSAHASRQEYGFFPGEFANSGFSAQGTLGYTLIAGDNAAITTATMPYGLTAYDACTTTENVAADAGCPANYRVAASGDAEWDDLQAGVVNANLGSIAPAAAVVGATPTQFDALISGVVSLKAALQDQYRMNAQKQLTMVTDGLK